MKKGSFRSSGRQKHHTLTTFNATSQHDTLLPVVDIHLRLIQGRVKQTTELTCAARAKAVKWTVGGGMWLLFFYFLWCHLCSWSRGRFLVSSRNSARGEESSHLFGRFWCLGRFLLCNWGRVQIKYVKRTLLHKKNLGLLRPLPPKKKKSKIIKNSQRGKCASIWKIEGIWRVRGR